MNAPVQPKRTLADKQDEKGRLLKAFRAARRAQWAELCEAEPRLVGIRSALRSIEDPRAIVTRLADSWVRTAPADVRIAVLREINRHAERQARREGRAVLDDPIPPAVNLFHASRELLGVR